MTSLTLLINHGILSLNPNSRFADGSTPWSVLANIAPGLVRMNEDGELLPSLATEWSHDEGYRTFRFTLREGVRLHSGRLLTPELVIWNFQRFFSGRFDTLFGRDYQGLTAIRADGDHGVVFEFDRPFPDFLHYLAWRTCIVDDVADQPCGAGPFRLAEWKRGEYIRLEAFDDYYVPGQPAVDEIRVIWASSAEAKLAAIRSGNVDVIENVPMLAAGALAEEGLLEYRTVASTRRAALVLNTQAGPLADLRVRKAVTHALDRVELTRMLFGDKAAPLTRSVLSSTPNPAITPYAYDVETARTLLKEAGVGEGLVLRGVSTKVAPLPKVSAYVTEALAELGISLDVRFYEDPPWWPFVYLDTEWDVAFQGMGVRPAQNVALQRDHRSDGPFNASGFADAGLDALIDRAAQLPGGPARAAAQSGAEVTLHENVPFIPLYSAKACYGWKPGVQGVTTNALGYLDLSAATAADQSS
ncbi:ABC transporter substrate-binding protein [Dactylosporangium roseum]|uniref:ABC transporter substrate-binding protein n=1 Tax=Dactylosporangium roseum TaxID=47989 RepID=A0ABY5ZE02_9ACTN|nr:ABC transporter substrate-binding protein [Dactylosporangium roseum]UWZ39178.1 ABC transporter substrate-binding protein [Dactylosporangium roseum]